MGGVTRPRRAHHREVQRSEAMGKVGYRDKKRARPVYRLPMWAVRGRTRNGSKSKMARVHYFYDLNLLGK